MSEIIVAKMGGTSNRDAEAVMQSMEWEANISVVSAPGKLDGEGPETEKVTDMLLDAHAEYMRYGEVSNELLERITSRYAMIADGLGRAIPRTWLDKIPAYVEISARQSQDAASMLGEYLQAQVYEFLGYTLLEPGMSAKDLGSNPASWRQWLDTAFKLNKKYVMPGNTTKINGQLVTFERGGSDITDGLAAYGVQAALNLNLTDNGAMSADPKLISKDRLKKIDHLLYEEGRALGRNGTGLLHPAAMVPLMRGNIPTEIRSTFNRDAAPTLMDNDTERAKGRMGRVVVLSLMENLRILRVHEPGMAEAVGRLATFETILANHGIAIVDSRGDDADRQKYFIKTDDADLAHTALTSAVHDGSVELGEERSFITLVGYKLETRLIDNIFELSLNSGMGGEYGAKAWQSQDNDLSPGMHSIRISVRPEEAGQVLDRIHWNSIEQFDRSLTQ